MEDLRMIATEQTTTIRSARTTRKGSTAERTKTKVDLRTLLRSTRDANPNKKKNEIIELYIAQILRDPELTRAALNHVAENEWSNINKNEEKDLLDRKPVSPLTIAKLRADMAHNRLSSILKLLMMDGRQLREYTGQELRDAGGSYRRLFRAIADTVAPGEIIGEHYKREKDLRAAIGL
jgi:hypothetical protein